MKKYFALILMLVVVISCKKEGLDYKKIDFAARKKVLIDWSDFENITLTRVAEKEKILYEFYEFLIKEYQENLIKNINTSDSLRNHKDWWYKEISRRQKEREAEAESESDILNLEIFYPDVQTEYNQILSSNAWYRESYKKELDSISKIFQKVPQNERYYEIDYEIKAYSPGMESNIVQNLRVWVDKESKIFKVLYLNLPTKVE